MVFLSRLVLSFSLLFLSCSLLFLPLLFLPLLFLPLALALFVSFSRETKKRRGGGGGGGLASSSSFSYKLCSFTHSLLLFSSFELLLLLLLLPPLDPPPLDRGLELGPRALVPRQAHASPFFVVASQKPPRALQHRPRDLRRVLETGEGDAVVPGVVETGLGLVEQRREGELVAVLSAAAAAAAVASSPSSALPSSLHPLGPEAPLRLLLQGLAVLLRGQGAGSPEQGPVERQGALGRGRGGGGGGGDRRGQPRRGRHLSLFSLFYSCSRYQQAPQPRWPPLGQVYERRRRGVDEDAHGREERGEREGDREGEAAGEVVGGLLKRRRGSRRERERELAKRGRAWETTTACIEVTG